jgi:FAD/FMN-containing dehydrogenase
MAGWRDLAASAPREATLTASLHGDRADLGFVWVGPRERAAERLIERLSLLAPGRGARIEDLSYLELQTGDDTVERHAIRRYWKGHYLPALPDDAIAALLAGRDGSSPNVSLQAYGGAIGEVADSGSAFDHRATAFEYVAAAGWTDPAEDDDRRAATRADAARIAPFAKGAYVNALGDEGQSGVRRAYGEAKLDRLRALKNFFDPSNVFHLNHNIAPSGR